MEIAILVLLIFCFINISLLLVFLVFKDIFNADVKKFFSKFRFSKKNEDYINNINAFVYKLSSALIKMSNDKVGALIIIENQDSLNQYINIGSKIDAEFFPELVYTIFYNKKSPLHDGAIIIRNWKIVSVSSYLPTSKKIINVKYGARHRAAFGICEKFDCFAFVVSETNGNITAVHLDEVHKLSNAPEKLTNQIIKILASANYIRFTREFQKYKKNNKEQ